MSPYLLALVAAATHAWWNFLLKRTGASDRIVGLTKVAEAVLFAPLFAIALWRAPAGGLDGLVPLAVIGAILSGANYWFLARAYARGDFSLVYPVSRGGILLVVPLLGWFAFGETITPTTAAAIILILLGIASLQLDALSAAALRCLLTSLATSPGTAPAFLAAAAAAGYTVWDKHAVQAIAPFTYFYAYTLLVAIGFALPLRNGAARAAARLDWQRHRTTIVAVGALNTVTYLLILLALKDGHSTRVIALRQLSIALGAWLGWVVLREASTPPRRLGVALIVAGSLLVALG